MLSKINPYIVSLIVIVFVLIIVGIFSSRIYRRFIEFISSWMTVLKMLAGGNGVVNVTGNDEVDKAIGAAGYSYDMKQDMFYSRMDAWQREMGYCRLYDEVAAPCGMIIDCEPINFEYDGKKWLIEFWKG